MFSQPPPHRPLYRVFHLTRTGSIFWADVINAADDADAIARLEAMAQDHALELWDRTRFVAKAEPPIGALVREMVVTTARTDAPAHPVEPADVSEAALPAKLPH